MQVTYRQKFHSFLSKYLLCVLGGLRDGSETSVGGQVDLLPLCYWVLLVYGLDLQMDFLFALGVGVSCLRVASEICGSREIGRKARRSRESGLRYRQKVHCGTEWRSGPSVARAGSEGCFWFFVFLSVCLSLPSSPLPLPPSFLPPPFFFFF